MQWYRGRPVNHQAQKSRSFVASLNRHLAWRFGGAVQVISPIYAFYDLGVSARLAASAPRLMRLQSSCGGANSRSAHCGRCPKCAFVAAALAAISDDTALYRQLFPRDPLDDVRLYEEWLAPGGSRPLTCAGTKEEIRLALLLARGRGRESAVFDSLGAAPAHATRDLAAYLASHRNPLVPPRMEKTLARYSRLDTEPLLRLLARA
jgi:hypothetical protein